MFTLETGNLVFVNSDGDLIPVKTVPTNFVGMEIGTHYIVGDYIYNYIGEVRQRRSIGIGEIGRVGKSFYVNVYPNTELTESTDELESLKASHHITNVKSKDEFEEKDILSIMNNYKLHYDSNLNMVKTHRSKLANNGERYVPELLETDDALTRIMKLMILHKKLILNNYRDKFDKNYTLDNLRSAINGATSNMTITKFLAWCDLLNLEWSFSVEDTGTNPHDSLGEVLTISKDHPLTCDFGEDDRTKFKVRLSDNEDPLKRLIKVALIKMNININDYKDRGSTPHLLNNMRSALKRGSKMMMPYFACWCEVLGLNYILSITDPEDGTCFKVDMLYTPSDYLPEE